MIVAIYARKSTDQNLPDAEKSVTRQVEHATAYATGKGWAVAPAHIYVDDGISGAEFAKRPGLVRLINALSPRPSFQVLVMSEESRLGREQIETAYLLKQLITAGVRVFYYLEDRERTLDSPTEKLLLSVATFADEMERDKARARTRDAMVRKARAGHVAAGRKYGYDNVAVTAADGSRSHVDRQINETEATVVRQIFERAAAGYGFRRIAHALNAEAAPAPRATHGRRSGWAASTVRDVLRSEVYHGVLIWGQTQKRDGWGQRVTRRSARQRPPEEWIRVERPDLQTRATYLRSSDGRLHGRPVNEIAAKYLLTGMAVCGQCGGALTIRTRAHGTRRLALYQCLTHVTKGPRICANRSAMRQRDAEGAVLETVRHLSFAKTPSGGQVVAVVSRKVSPRGFSKGFPHPWGAAVGFSSTRSCSGPQGLRVAFGGRRPTEVVAARLLMPAFCLRAGRRVEADAPSCRVRWHPRRGAAASRTASGRRSNGAHSSGGGHIVRVLPSLKTTSPGLNRSRSKGHQLREGPRSSPEKRGTPNKARAGLSFAIAPASGTKVSFTGTLLASREIP
jgi:DNA invertase Pin-like site-specific DNA recombinase